MSGYIDLHNHILPAVDDGPENMEESMLLARDLASAGYEIVVATPHTIGGTPTPETILRRVENLQARLDKQEIPLRILPGAEQQIEPELCERLERKEILTLNNTCYLMLELPMLQPLPVYTEQLLFKLAQSGYHPVIPHPERVMALQMNQQMLHRLHRLGAIYQVTWGAFTGLLGPAAAKTARYMLEAGLVHFLATDAHHPESRLLALDNALKVLEKTKGPSFIRTMLTERPRLLLEDRPLALPEPVSQPSRPPKRVPFISRLFRV